MQPAEEERLVVFYVPGLDLRRLSGEETPYISALLEEFPTVRIRTIPDTELLATILTGVYPHEHGLWQVRFRGWSTDGGPLNRMSHLVPDVLATTLQGVVHAATGGFDLATVPWRRRRRFELRRFKYERRVHGWVEPSSSAPSVLARLDGSSTRYRFCSRFSQLEPNLDALLEEPLRLEFFEFYAFDLTEHWNLDRPDVMREASRKVDAAVRKLHRKSRERGRRFLLLSDHGQERVRDTIDLRAALREGDVPSDEYALYLQVPSARFWFRTERARGATLEVLERLPDVTVMEYPELRQYGLAFDSGACGELYAFAHPGRVFFPHDFYQPLANLFLGLADPQQRPRIGDPVHRGCHGYLPDHPSEVGFLTLADEGYEPVREEIELVDLAPTFLELVGARKPERLSGTCPFVRR